MEERDLQLVRERDGRYLVDDDEQHGESGKARPEDGHPEFERESTSCKSSGNSQYSSYLGSEVRTSTTDPSSTAIEE